MKGIQGEQALDKTQPEVQVPGYGTMPLDMLKRHVQALSKEFNDSIQQGEFLKAAYRTEQFYNALMALAKALKQQGVSETSSTGMGGGSAGIGGGAGLGIEKSPIEKVLEKPFGESVEEGLDRPKVLFNPKPMKKGSGDSPDDYEYTDYVPRGKEDKEAWAIKRTVDKQKLKPNKPKELNTGFYKNYLGNRPVREDDVEENVKDAIKNVRKKFRQSAVGRAREHGYRIEEANPNQQLALYNPSGTTYRGEYMPKMEPDPVDKAKPLSRAKNVPADLSDVDDEIRQKQLKKKLLDIIDNDPSFIPRLRHVIKGYYFDGKTYDQLAKDFNISSKRVFQLVKKAERLLRHPERAKQLRPFLLADGQIYSTGGGAGESYRKYNSKPAGLDEEQAPMFTPEEKMVNANDPRSDGWRVYKDKPAGAKESAIMKGIQNEYELERTKKIEFSKENPPSLDYLYRHFLHDLLSSTNTIEPKDWIDNMNKHYGLSYTFRDYQNMGHKDYTNNWDKIVQKYILRK